MSRHQTHRTPTLRARAIRMAPFAVSTMIAGTAAAQSAERVKDELDRKPVFYNVGSGCGTAGCLTTLVATPGGKKRIELSNITCVLVASNNTDRRYMILRQNTKKKPVILYMKAGPIPGESSEYRYHTEYSSRFHLKKSM